MQRSCKQRFGLYLSGKNKGRGPQPRGTGNECPVERFQINKLLLSARIGRQEQQPEHRFGEKRRYPYKVRVQDSVVRTGYALKEMSSHTPLVATTMTATRIFVLMMATSFFLRQIAFHANQTIVMMMMRNDRHHQHDHADEEQEKCDVPFLFHSFIFIDGKDKDKK